MFLSFIISWFGVGFLSCILLILWDLRNEEYNEVYMLNYFGTICGVILCGYATPFIILIAAFCEKEIGDKILKKIYAVLYKIANIGKDSNE